MNWLKSLEDANSVVDVLEIVNDYLQEQPDHFWSGIPDACRPSAIATEAELHAWHHRLVEVLTRAKAPNIHLQDLCVFFVRASIRTHQIKLRDSDPGAAPNEASFAAAPRRRRSGDRF